MKIILPWPPSVNTYWRHPSSGPLAGRSLISVKGRAYRSDVEVAVLQQKARMRLRGTVAVDVMAYPPDRRQRDIDNLGKSLFDALTHAGVWLDDDQIDDMRIRRARDGEGRVILGGRVEVTITLMERAA